MWDVEVNVPGVRVETGSPCHSCRNSVMPLASRWGGSGPKALLMVSVCLSTWEKCYSNANFNGSLLLESSFPLTLATKAIQCHCDASVDWLVTLFQGQGPWLCLVFILDAPPVFDIFLNENTL